MNEKTWNPTVIWSRPEEERAGTPLLVLLHGYLSNEEDLMGLAPMLPKEFTIVSVRAPQALGPGFTWFPLMQDLDYSFNEVKSAITDLWSWLEPISKQHSSVSLLGFSMGMAVATSLLRYQPEAIKTVVGLSGFAVPEEGTGFFNDEKLRQLRKPLFWGRDQEDPVITAEKVEYTHGWATTDVHLTKVLYSNMLHSVNAQEMAHVHKFLSAVVLKTEAEQEV
ncbi:alpha/beta hydrolase [Glutamicibacter ardleyensis]|uniref:alpha/beta hydrolase n=1 Tax=Glutamicibacter ardleyensis TaxID=225894 RepID=UPI003FD5579D